MRRHYRPMTPAQRDGLAERRAERAAALGIPPREDLRPRDTLRILVEVDGQRFEVEGKPARRCNQFKLTLNGEPIGTGGAETAWREIQKRRAPLMSARRCA